MQSRPFLTKTIASLPMIFGATVLSLAMISPVLSQPIQVAQSANNITSLSGIWHYDENGQRMPDVKIEQNGDRITMILSYASSPLTLMGTRTGNKFRVPSRRGSHVYKGTISSDGSRVEGTFILQGQEIPFVLQRVAPE